MATETPPQPNAVNLFGRPAKRSQILAMQRVLYAIVLDPSVDPARKAQCARSYEVLEERLRILRGEPMPGSLRPTESKHSKRAPKLEAIEPSAPSPSEPTKILG